VKFCTRCKKEKPITSFWADPSKKDGRRSLCGTCSRKKNRKESRVRKPENTSHLVPFIQGYRVSNA